MPETKPGPRTEPAALAANGWTFLEKCRCSGVLKHKYHHEHYPGVELEWWVRYHQFRITYNGRQTKVPLTKISDMDKTLKSLQP